MAKKKQSNVKRILNCLPSRETERDWTMDDAVGAGLVDAAPTIPASKDLREAWWDIGDQLATGSCVGWAAVDSVLRWHFVKAGRLAKTAHFSSRFTWMASKETDTYVARPTTFIESDGTFLKAALDIARKYGAVPDSVLPFASGRLYGGSANAFYATAAGYKIASYFNLGTNLQDWRVWLANHGPILTRLGVDDTWDHAHSTHGNLDVYHPATIRGGHAVALVGYKPDRFIVRNSWGVSWGDKGFGYASIPYASQAFTEAYGVKL